MPDSMDLIKGTLADIIGQRVRVHIRLNEADQPFGSQIAVVGTLEGNADAGNFRVLSGDDPSDRTVSYAYFRLDDVRCLADRRTTKKGTFDCGAIVVVYVGGNPTHPYDGVTEDLDYFVVMADGSSRPGIIVV